MTTPAREIYWILGVLLAVVSIASGIGQLLRRRHPQSAAIANLNARIGAWWVLIAVGGAAWLTGPIGILLLFAFISVASLLEFLNGVLTRPLMVLCVMLAVPGQYLMIGSWIPACGFLALAVFVSGGDRKRLTGTLLGLMLCVFGLSHIPALAMLPIPGFEGRAPLLMAFVVLIAQVSDVLQYVWGKLIGRRQLLPTLSPSKTMEGLVGGVLSVTALGLLLSPLTPFTRWQAAAMAFVIAICGFLGGVAMSAIKRDRGLKDWSQLIAGHGGMLDRVDSLCVSAPVFFYVTRYFLA